VHWFANTGPAPAKAAASAARLAEHWAPDGVRLHFHPVDGAPFWASEGNVHCTAMLEATNAVFGGSAP
jgi:hypothetical protein